MKVLHISAASEFTGAGKATLLTHEELLNKGIDTKVLFQKSNLKEIGVYSFHRGNLFLKSRRFIFTSFDRLILFFYPKRKFFFSPGYFGVGLKKHFLIEWADIVHIHWSNQGFINIREIQSWKKPVVWTLRDMWAFTGGCHQSFSCDRYTMRCGHCVALGSVSDRDLSRKMLEIKLATYKELSIKWVAISSWILRQAMNSYVLGTFKIELIHSGVSSESFKVLDKVSLRAKYGFNNYDKIVLIGAGNLRSEYKGFQFVKDVLCEVDQNIFVLTFGADTFRANEVPQVAKHFGFVEGEILIELYNLSDFFFAPSVAEAMGKTILEAQFCGVPVLCFNNTGPADIVEHMSTGYLADFKSLEDLKLGFDLLMMNDWDSDYIRKRSIGLFDISLVADKYINLYQTLL